jgi:hypothetical protein
MLDFGLTESPGHPVRSGVEAGVEGSRKGCQRPLTNAGHSRFDGRGEPLGTVRWQFARLAPPEQVDGDRPKLSLEPAPCSRSGQGSGQPW